MEFIDSQIESTAKAFTESFAYARYASTAAPVRYPRTIYLYKWLSIFYDGKNIFGRYQNGNTAGWQKTIIHNVDDGTGHLIDVTQTFSPPLIGIPDVMGGDRSQNLEQDPFDPYNLHHIQYLEPVDLDLVLNQMIGPARKTGDMKTIIDGGMFATMKDNEEAWWSYKDNYSEGANGKLEALSPNADHSGITGELQHVTADYLTGTTSQTIAGIGRSFDDPNHPIGHLQPVSFAASDEFGEVLIAQSMAPAPGNPCIIIEWIITNNGPINPVVSGAEVTGLPIIIPIPDFKTIWSRAANLLPWGTASNGPFVMSIANKLYPQFKNEAEWRAAGANF